MSTKQTQVEKLRAMRKENPEAFADLERLATVHKDVSANSFAAFFYLVFGLPLLKHWSDRVNKIFSAVGKGRGVLFEAFRGSAKTTTWNIAWGAYMLGKYPSKSGLIVQAGDDTAKDNSEAIADIIMNNPGWKYVFPNIVPDEKKGWGAAGYEVMDTSMDYDKWRSLNTKRKDPSFIGLGYKSSSIIGKRPYWLTIDDINDEKNTISDKESRRVNTLLKGTIFPAANMSKYRIVIGTPWNESDAIHYVISTTEFDHIKIPVKIDGELVWPEVFDEAMLAKELNLAKEIEYARMYLLDLSKTKGLILKKQWLEPKFTASDINQDWPVYFGIDYTSTEDPSKEEGDYFVILAARELPGGKGLVIEDGFRGRVTDGEAQEIAASWWAAYPTARRMGVEAILSGQNFYINLLQNALLKAAGAILSPVRFNKNKGYRFEKELAPMVRAGRIKISDAEKEIFYHLTQEWMNWQGNEMEDLHHNDVLDAMYTLMISAGFIVSPIAAVRKKITNALFKRQVERKSARDINWSKF